MRISDWSSDVCSSDLAVDGFRPARPAVHRKADLGELARAVGAEVAETEHADRPALRCRRDDLVPRAAPQGVFDLGQAAVEAQHLQRSEEHTSELQSLMRISYAVFCLKKKNHTHMTIYH